MSKPTKRCPKCNGVGWVDMPGAYGHTLDVLRAAGKPVTAAELCGSLSANATAVNNRLATLERLGLVTSERDGRKRLFRPKED